MNPPFYQTNVVTLYISIMCKLFLGQSGFLAFLPQYLSES